MDLVQSVNRSSGPRLDAFCMGKTVGAKHHGTATKRMEEGAPRSADGSTPCENQVLFLTCTKCRWPNS